MVGGTIAEATGGKFANGALTGAFSRAFNDEEHSSREARRLQNLARIRQLQVFLGGSYPSLARYSGVNFDNTLPLNSSNNGEFSFGQIRLRADVLSGDMEWLVSETQHQVFFHEALHGLVLEYEGGALGYAMTEFFTNPAVDNPPGYRIWGLGHEWVDRKAAEIASDFNQVARNPQPRADISSKNYYDNLTW